MIRNVHERTVAAPVGRVGALLDRLGGPDDEVWPAPEWPPLVLDRVEYAVGLCPRTIERWSPWVRALRRLEASAGRPSTGTGP